MTTNEEKVERYAAPDRSMFMPQFLHTQILPDLWMGGTHDDDVLSVARPLRDKAFLTLAEYDYVVTAYAYARPADWEVKEVRFPYYDSDRIEDLPIDEVLQVSRDAYDAWTEGKRVLVRCQAGLNRSGLIVAFMLIQSGYTGEEAIALMREKRGRYVLCNDTFADLVASLKPEDFAALA